MSVVWKIAAAVIDVAFNEVNVAVGIRVGCLILSRALNEAECGYGGGREEGERPRCGPHIIDSVLDVLEPVSIRDVQSGNTKKRMQKTKRYQTSVSNERVERVC